MILLTMPVFLSTNYYKKKHIVITHCRKNEGIYLPFFNSSKIFTKNIANMHREHDVPAFFKHRLKHRGRCFFQNIA